MSQREDAPQSGETVDPGQAEVEATPAPEPAPVDEAVRAAEPVQADADADAAVEAAEADDLDEQAVDEAEAPVIELVDPVQAELDQLRQHHEQAQSRLRTVSKAYTDLQKEMEAFRKRQQSRAEAQLLRRTGEILEKFFEPIQNLKRALGVEDADVDTLRQGVTMVLGQFSARLGELGVKEAPGVGATFDPNVHEALAIMPVPDPEQDGKVIFVHTTGYMVGDKPLQPAQVVIGKFEEGAAAEA